MKPIFSNGLRLKLCRTFSMMIVALLTYSTAMSAELCSFANWVQGKSYAAGSIVRFTDGKFYIAEHANPGYSPVISTWYWDPYTCSGAGSPTPAPAPAPAPSPTVTWSSCATEGGICNFSGSKVVRYGAMNAFVLKTLTGPVACQNSTFGDPIVGVVKSCEISNTVSSPISSGPDLEVTNLTWTPSSPSLGSPVTFVVTVRNRGTTATPSGTTIGISFAVDNNTVSWASTQTSLAAGASVTMSANGGPNGSKTWSATSGTHLIDARVDDVNRIAESNETNNRLTKSLPVSSIAVPTPTPIPTPTPVPAPSEPVLQWRQADLTNFTSYPDPGSEECLMYNGCTWAGQFAALSSKQPESWVKANNIVAVHSKDFAAYKLKTLRIRQGTKQIDAIVYDMCADSDCNGCCTANARRTGFLLDLEKYTAQRFGSGSGVVEWTCVNCSK